MFQEGISDDRMKRGYCYDYLQKVSDYTNWEYEYVYGNWTELFRMLQRGEIDCLGGVSLTEERKDTMTANAFDEDKKNALAAGMDGHLPKPIEISKLVKTLGKFV